MNLNKINSFRLDADNNKLLNLIEKLLIDIIESEQIDPNSTYNKLYVMERLREIREKFNNIINLSMDINTILPSLQLLQIATDYQCQNLDQFTAISPLKLGKFLATELFRGLVKYTIVNDIYNKNNDTKTVTLNSFNSFKATTENAGLVKFVGNADAANCIKIA